jgi:hypothetical protein
MKYALAVLFVLAAAVPALGRELMTRNKATIYEKPDMKSKVLAQLPENVKIMSDDQKDFWFHVSVDLGDKTVSGWVNQTDVETMMGRSKGQLLADTERLLNEVTELRSKAKVLQQELAGVRNELDKAKQENANLKEALTKTTADLEATKTQMKRLKAPPDEPNPPEKPPQTER